MKRFRATAACGGFEDRLHAQFQQQLHWRLRDELYSHFDWALGAEIYIKLTVQLREQP